MLDEGLREGGDFFGSGGQAGEIEGEAANECCGICGGRCVRCEIVDAYFAGCGLQRFEGPVFFVFRLDGALVLHGIGGGVDGGGGGVWRD